ncbi:hypothetical protein SNOG_12341 [Parastagonospora nodorum SN15]|uniref:Biotin carboxylation domain-containing protein n=1 Tax=Phaeosphaeria nodorum (strain SN15 / ATCC MYA-4574 / FGSC 10173) TaxID=321614 RepID=Q0U7C3_PHANO|nr:hypothetical protein SNOG_12341 [Parastagonospora nodorum SN15]EAT80154.2 hypothetical protein SNOG_12341 [Parastagonospora nodorum SN15]
MVSNRELIAKVTEDALRIAREVEHTITESISMTDIVQAQLFLAQGAKLDQCSLPNAERDPRTPPVAHSIQLRVTAENVQSDWSLSIGKITSFQFPTGNGVRIDTHLIPSQPSIVSADFDSLLAKIIITASSWSSAVKKAQRALSDTQISGVKTNISILRAILAHPDFSAGACDTQWLERNHSSLLAQSLKMSSARTNIPSTDATTSPSLQLTTASTLFRAGDAWSLSLSSNKSEPASHHLELTRVLRNDFPTSLTAEILFTTPATSTPYTLTMASTTGAAIRLILHTSACHFPGNW